MDLRLRQHDRAEERRFNAPRYRFDRLAVPTGCLPVPDPLVAADELGNSLSRHRLDTGDQLATLDAALGHILGDIADLDASLAMSWAVRVAVSVARSVVTFAPAAGSR